ncbi:MAG: TonB-dependent receptor [Pyrinomonadaceae bacterium]
MQKLAVFLMFVLLSVTIAVAQNTTGKIVGAVSAPDGAVPGATVVVRDNQTGKERTVNTRDDGTFEVSLLEFGTYTVTINGAGFKTVTVSEVKIDAGREFPLNVSLEVGQVSEEVTVTAGGSEINATTAELSTTISGEQVRELPLNTRNPLALVSLTAGASATSGAINGNRTSATTVTRDGLNVQDNFIRSGTFVSDQPTVDDVSEISITTQNAGSDQGAGVSFVQLVTPRGGRDFHGNLYIFNRNSEFAANNFFGNSINTARPFLNRNQFGGTISGPMPLPYFGEGTPTWLKNKGFFYFNYEQFRLAQQARINGLSTLLAPARQGLFTFNQPGVGLTTVNVLSGQGFTSGFIAGQGGVIGVDPLIQSRYLDLMPTTGNGATTGTGFTQVINGFLRSDPLRRDSWTARVDLDFNDENSFNVVYRRNNQQDARTDVAAGFSPSAYVFQGGPTNFLAMAYRRTFSSKFTNEVRGGFQYSEPFFSESNVPEDFILATAGGLALTNPLGAFKDQGRNTDYRNVQDNAVYVLGDHSLRFGGGFEMYDIQRINQAGATATYTSAINTNVAIPALTAQQVCGSATCINATDLARLTNLRYFLGGFVGAATRTASIKSLSEGYGFDGLNQLTNYEVYSAYVADQWRVRPNLTLNLGVRWEMFSALANPQGIFLEPVIGSNSDIRSAVLDPNGVLNVIGGNSGTPNTFHKSDKNNFAPNIGAAWTLGDGFMGKVLGRDTVIRGGFSINYFNDEFLKSTQTLADGNPGLGNLAVNALRPGTTSAVLNASLSTVPGFIAVPNLSTAPAFTAPPRTFLQNNNAAGGLGQLFGTDPNIQLPAVYQWNVGIQKNIGLGAVLEVRYVGNTSSDLIRTVDYNEVDVVNNGFFTDFARAQTNLTAVDAHRALLATQGLTAAQINAIAPRSLLFNANVPGSLQLQVINNLAVGPTGVNPWTNATLLTQVQQGLAGGYAQNIIVNGLRGSVVFQQNPNILITEILSNAARFNYHAMQAEVRRRFKNGVSFQANYTFQKTLTDLPNEDQNRQGEVQESSNPNLNYGRSDFDRTHVFNANMIFELPFGRGKSFLDRGGWVNAVFGGWQLTSIFNIESGAPIGIIDPRGTKSITFKSGRQSASSSLSPEEIKGLMGLYNTPNGVYFVNPSVLNATITNATTGEVRQGFDLFQPLPTGFALTSVRAANPVGTAPFAGQVFFFNGTFGAPATGNLPRNFINGTPFFNWDAGLSKNFRFNESMRLQLRMEAFNVLNKTVFNQTADLNINSNNFGLITTTRAASTPRVIQFGARFDF